MDSDYLFIQPQQFVIAPNSEFGFEVIFRPLLAKEDSAKVTVKSAELGEFVFPMKLVGQPSTLIRNLNFKTNLGSDTTQSFKFLHFGKKPTTYTCRV